MSVGTKVAIAVVIVLLAALVVLVLYSLYLSGLMDSMF